MILKNNKSSGTLFENFTPAHRDEILKYFDPKQPDSLMKWVNPNFLKHPTTETELYQGGEVQFDEYNKVPVMLYLSCLCQITTVYRVPKETGNSVPTADALISLYHKRGISTPIVEDILLVDENKHALCRFTLDIDEYKCNYKNIEALSDLEKRLFLVLNYGLEISVDSKPGASVVTVYHKATDRIITERTFITL